MLTKLIIKNFKRFNEDTIELGNPVVFIGPNDSGKTSALQAIALWEIGFKRWNEKRKKRPTPEKRPGVTINRKDLISIPVRHAIHLWRDLSVRNIQKVVNGQHTENIRIDITIEGVTEGVAWRCGLEFDYANEESIYCRPLRINDTDRMSIPGEAAQIKIAYLPPMSGLSSEEFRMDTGAINVRIGEGRTAEVLRNLCYLMLPEGKRNEDDWKDFCECLETLFGIRLDKPLYIPERGEITLSYRTRSDKKLDIGCSGRGMQQTMLLLAYMASNRGSVLLIDEPDAHLEILRQRQIYQVLSEWAHRYNSQVIIASHSEVILNEAADRDVVVAFLGKAHRIDDRGDQVKKSLREIGFENYYQAEQKGWVLYLEGSTDLSILRSLASRLQHPAQVALERPFVEYIGNQPTKAFAHFYGLREAKKDLVGVAVYDRLDKEIEDKQELHQIKWKKREIENYICCPESLIAWAKDFGEQQLGGELFQEATKTTMIESIKEVEEALTTLRKSPWSPDTKISDDFLNPLFEMFFNKLNLPNMMQKSSYHELAFYMPPEKIDPEVSQVLDTILVVSRKAKPVVEIETA